MDLSQLNGAQSSGVEVHFYSHRADPIVLSDLGWAGVDGRSRWDEAPSVVSVATQKAMGGPSGSWTLQLKPGKSARHGRTFVRDIFDRVIDGDWVDIVFRIGETRHHAMRGIVDRVRRLSGISKGAVTEVFTITGRDQGSIWENTPVWFNTYSDENLAGSMSQDVIGAVEGVMGTPENAVRGFMLRMLERLGQLGRASILMPQGMPGVGEAFYSSEGNGSLRFDADHWNPAQYDQIAVSAANWLNPQGTLWQLGAEWSDPAWHELYTDLYRKGESVSQWYQHAGLDPKDAEMVLVFRERPFTSLTARYSWESLPTFTLPWEKIDTCEVGTGGDERYNAYFVSPVLVQSLIEGGGIDLCPPLMDEEDVFLRGMRRLDVTSKYTSASADLLGLSTKQRAKMRDWHCLNPYLLQGTITPTIGIPDLRIGTRLRISGRASQKEDETYYVESVSNSWSRRPGVRTSVGVSRGWVGTDQTLYEALQTMAARYTVGGFPG
jgi:hypothetical protein